MIALAVPEIDLPYFAELARFVVEAAEEHGLTVLVDQTSGLADRERLVMAGFRGHLIDGLILSPVGLRPGEIAAHDGRTPLVLLGEKVGAGPADHVAIDNVAAARTATEHVLALGRRRVAVIGDQPDSPAGSGVAGLRRTGYEQAMRAHGISVEPMLIGGVTSFDRTQGAAAAAQLLDSDARPDAMFCFSDTLALGALRLLAERGVRVPGDVAVIGIDDIEDGRWSTPTLTTVAPDKVQIARLSVEMLLDRMGANGASHVAPRDIRAGFALAPRESTTGTSAQGRQPLKRS